MIKKIWLCFVVLILSMVYVERKSVAQQLVNGYRIFSNVVAASVGTPASGTTSLYIDSVTKKLTTKDDTGTVTGYGTGSIASTIQLLKGNGSGGAVATDLTGDATTSGGQATSLAAQNKIRTCTVIIGDPGAASPVLADDNDSPVACGNRLSADWTITSVACWANAGSPTVTPILTGGSATSILTGALTCGTAAWAAGTVQATAPVVHTFSADGATCASTPCTADVNITTAGGTAKYLVVVITGTIPGH